MPEINLNYELAPRPGMLASQRKAELDGSKFVSVRNLAYMIYKKPDGSPLMTYQETLDNRELVKNNIINTEISMGLLQNDLGNIAVPTSQSPQPIPNGAQMTQPQQQQMPFPQQQQQAPMSPQQFAQVPMAAPQQPQPQFAPQPQMQQQQYAPPQAAQPQQQQYAAPQPQFAQAPVQMPSIPQMQPMQQMPPMQQMAPPPAAAAAPPLENAPVTGKKRKAAAGNAVAPPPGNPVAPPPGFAPQPQAGVPVVQFQQPPAGQPAQFAPPQQGSVPFIPTQPGQPQFVPNQQAPQQFAPQQQAPAPQAGGDIGALVQRLDAIGKGVEVAANNGDQALKAIAALKTELGETRNTLNQMLAALHHMYLVNQQLANMTEGKANDLPSFCTFLQKYVGSPQ